MACYTKEKAQGLDPEKLFNSFIALHTAMGYGAASDDMKQDHRILMGEIEGRLETLWEKTNENKS